MDAAVETATRPVTRKWLCTVCNWVYDEAVGAPDDGIAAGTRFEDIDPDWFCPECGVGKDDFKLM